ncbi:MAG: beta-ketoacyl-ACP synthase III [Bryobacteraceae bacterium]
MPKAKITALGTYTPPRVLTNKELEQMVETSNEWILDRTGISERHIADPDVATSDMGTAAARDALARSGIEPSTLDAILLCTVTPDMFFPSTACLIQNNLGAARAWGFDLIAACSSFVYGMVTAAQFVESGRHKRVLVIGADTMSRIIDYTDRNTCVLFGDGAGAMLIEPADEGEGVGFIDFVGEIDGSGGQYLKMPAGGSRLPSSHETIDQRLHYVHQDGQQVFRYAVRKMYELCEEILKRNHLTAKDVAVLIPHQANKRIICATADRIGLPSDRVVINIGKFGNTTSATIPLATNDAVAEGRLKKGDLVLFIAVGAGYTAGASLWRWAY